MHLNTLCFFTCVCAGISPRTSKVYPCKNHPIMRYIQSQSPTVSMIDNCQPSQAAGQRPQRNLTQTLKGQSTLEIPEQSMLSVWSDKACCRPHTAPLKMNHRRYNNYYNNTCYKWWFSIHDKVFTCLIFILIFFTYSSPLILPDCQDQHSSGPAPRVSSLFGQQVSIAIPSCHP